MEIKQKTKTSDSMVMKNLKLSERESLRKACDLAPGEDIRYFSNIWKVSKRGKQKKRSFLVSSKAVYTTSERMIGGTKLCRKIPLEKIQLVFVSLTTNEFVIHVREEFDTKFYHEDYSRIVKVIQDAYEELAKMRDMLSGGPTVMMIDVDASEIDHFMVRRENTEDEIRGIEAAIYLYIHRPRTLMIRLPVMKHAADIVLDGVRIRSVVAGSTADKAGLKKGMIIQEIEGKVLDLKMSGTKVHAILNDALAWAIKKECDDILRIKVHDTVR
eukprot:jgi/Bigna1/65994/fgenesh1_pg.1_\